MKKLIRKIFYILLASVACAIIGFSVLLFNYSHSPIDNKSTTVLVDIPIGTSLSEVTNILHEASLVKNRLFFYGLVLIKRASQSIRAGEYEFNTSLTPSAMIDKLLLGNEKFYYITIHEDLSIREIAERLDTFKLINKEDFFELARDKAFLESLNIKSDSVEGYLFPDTYRFSRSMSTRQIIRIMVNQFWEKVTPEMIKRAEELGFNTHQFVTIASMIGKESRNQAKKPMISAEFHDRLKKGMRLQSNATAVYDLDDFNGKITRSHLKRNSAYNTYIVRGLPPGPIANPGIDSLKAALYPAKVN